MRGERNEIGGTTERVVVGWGFAFSRICRAYRIAALCRIHGFSRFLEAGKQYTRLPHYLRCRVGGKFSGMDFENICPPIQPPEPAVQLDFQCFMCRILHISTLWESSILRWYSGPVITQTIWRYSKHTVRIRKHKVWYQQHWQSISIAESSKHQLCVEFSQGILHIRVSPKHQFSIKSGRHTITKMFLVRDIP